MNVLTKYFSKIGLAAFFSFVVLISLGSILIYFSLALNSFILFLTGYILIILGILLLISVSAVEVVFKKEKLFDAEKLKGKIGKSLTNIRKNEKGVIFIEDEEWTAIALEEIKKGEKIIVEDIEKNILYVKKIK